MFGDTEPVTAAVRPQSQMVFEAEDNRPLDARLLWARFRRRLPIFAVVFCVLSAAVMAAVLSQPPVYTAAASVLIDQRDQGILRPAGEGEGVDRRLDPGLVDTQVELLRSRALAHVVVDRLKLLTDPEFNSTLRRPSFLDNVRASALSGLRPASSAKPPLSPQDVRERVTDAVLSRLKVNRVGTTYVLDVATTADQPDKAREIANAFSQGYLALQIGQKVDVNRSRDTSIRERLDGLRRQVQAAETAVEQYKIDHNLLSTQGQTLTEQEISALDQQLATTRAQQAEIQARANTAKAQLSRGSSGDDVGEALSSPVIQQLRQQRATASQRVADLSSRYGERHPSLVSARGNLADIDRLIQEEIRRVISNLEAQSEVARQRTGSIQNSVERARSALAGSNQSSVQLKELQRNLDSVRQLYETLLNRYKETATEQGLERSEARIVSPAQTPTGPSGPKRGLGAAAAMMLGLIGGLAAVVLVDALDASFSTASALKAATGLPCLSSLPTVASTLPRGRPKPANPIDYVSDEPLSGFAEAFRSLRTSLMFARPGTPMVVLAITSALPNEGKSSTAMCLGRALAMTGVSTVIVDCDIRRHALSRAVAPHITAGLIEVLRGESTLGDALLTDPVSGAHVLPLAARPTQLGDLFTTPAAKQLLDDLRSRYSFVILDTAPVLPIADTRVLATLADAVLVLVRWRRTPASALKSALDLLAQVEAPVVGTALTFVDLKRQAKTAYGDPENFYKSYSSYYN